MRLVQAGRNTSISLLLRLDHLVGAVSVRTLDVKAGILRLAPDGLVEEGPDQRVHLRRLCVVCCTAVAALDVLPVADIRPDRLQRGRHLAGMTGMNSIVAGGGGDERRRIVDVLLQQLIRAEAADELPVGGVGVAVLRDP